MISIHEERKIMPLDYKFTPDLCLKFKYDDA